MLLRLVSPAKWAAAGGGWRAEVALALALALPWARRVKAGYLSMSSVRRRVSFRRQDVVSDCLMQSKGF